MAKDDYFRIVYLILKILYEYKKKHIPVDIQQISAEALQIEQGYRDEILGEMLEEGYVKGFNYDMYIAGDIVTELEDIKVTPKGIEYLQDNNKMKEVAAKIGKAVEKAIIVLIG